MKKTEIRKTPTNKLIVEYSLSYARHAVNINLGRGVKRTGQKLKWLEKELLDREVLTQEDIEVLNM